MLITVNAPTAAASLADFPVMVTFPPILALLIQASGADLRFVQPGAPAIRLSHELQGGGGGMPPMAWVKLPVAGNGVTFYAYFNNAQATDGSQPSAVWNDGFGAVWHLEGDAADSTTHQANGTLMNTTPATGAVGSGLTFHGPGSLVTLPPNLDSLKGVPGVTMSGWVLPMDPGAGTQAVVGLTIDNGAVPTPNSRATMVLLGGQVQAFFRVRDFVAAVNVVIPYSPPASEWHHWTCTTDFVGSVTAFYVDGQPVSGVPQPQYDQPHTPNTLSTGGALGGEEDGSGNALNGSLDEVRISGVARSAEWVAMDYASMTNALLTFGAVESY